MPAMMFYIGDWQKAPEIRALSLAARGLWIEMLCLMWESEERGVLLLHGKPISTEVLARQVGFPVDVIEPLLSELEEYGVFSRREEDGAIYCRRMVEEGKLIEKRRVAGLKGWEVKSLLKQNSSTCLSKIQAKDESLLKICLSKIQATLENENEYEYEDENESENEDEDENKESNESLFSLEENDKINCQQIVDLFNKICTDLPKVKILSSTRINTIKKRMEDLKTIEDWRKFFERVHASDFLNNRTGEGWRADFDWCLKSSNFIRIIEGKYDNIKNSDDVAEQAAKEWNEVIRQIRKVSSYGKPVFDCELTAEVVRRIGWDNLCKSTNINADRKNFMYLFSMLADKAGGKGR